MSSGALLEARMRVTTQLGEEIEGLLFGQAPNNDLILEERDDNADPTRPTYTYRLLRYRALQNIELVDGAPPMPPDAPRDMPLPELDTHEQETRLQRNIEKAYADFANLGRGVTVRAQRLFDALRKTMPCRWDGECIIVLDEVTVPPPYSPESCTAKPSSQPLLHRVQKVLAGELIKLQG
jgi:hypothetical protein